MKNETKTEIIVDEYYDAILRAAKDEGQARCRELMDRKSLILQMFSKTFHQSSAKMQMTAIQSKSLFIKMFSKKTRVVVGVTRLIEE